MRSLAEDLEEQFGAGPRQGNEAQFVYDQQLEARQPLLEVEQSLLVCGLDELVHQPPLQFAKIYFVILSVTCVAVHMESTRLASSAQSVEHLMQKYTFSVKWN